MKTAFYSFLIAQFFFVSFSSCQSEEDNQNDAFIVVNDSTQLEQETELIIDTNSYVFSWQEYIPEKALVNNLKTPEGFSRINLDNNSYGDWLRHLPLKDDNTVYLYNGEMKNNQSAQFKVLDIDVGDRDLQQCADAVMRLRAEYLFAQNDYEGIHFNYTNGFTNSFKKWSEGYYPKLTGNSVNWVASSSNNSSYKSFKKYLINVFNYAGTASLSKELNQVQLSEVMPGDVFIKGGFPGHAVIVLDVAINKVGEKCFLIAQSYMPAQNIHILKNPNKENSPWYFVNDIEQYVYTPEWTFEVNQLKRFKE